MVLFNKIKNWYQVFIDAILILLSAMIILLIIQNKELNNLLIKSSFGQFNNGDYFSKLKVMTISGEELFLEFDKSSIDTVLFIFSTECPYCEQSILKWNDLQKEFDDKFNFIGISVDNITKTSLFILKTAPNFNIVIPLQTNFREDYKISGFPQTVVINKSGKVERYWLGLFNETIEKEVRIFLIYKSHA